MAGAEDNAKQRPDFGDDLSSEQARSLDSSTTSIARFASHIDRFRHDVGAQHMDREWGTRRVTRASSSAPIVAIGAKRKTRAGSASKATSPAQRPTTENPKEVWAQPRNKRRRESSRYAPPSKYAHLPPLQDVLEPNLICVFVGTNPGISTSTAGHAYAHPSNLFWKLLHSSGCTDERLRPEQDVDLPRLYEMGNTNIVERPSRDAAELSKAEMAAGTPILETKFAKYQPEAVCIVGKGIWEAVWRWRYKREIRKDEFKYGWQDEKERMGKTETWSGARVFVTSSTSGLAASLRPHEKEAIWAPFGQWVKKRRKERRQAADSETT